MFLAVDLETTGLDPETDYIVEVAAILLDDKLEELGRYASNVRCPALPPHYQDKWAIRQHLSTGLLRDSGGGWLLVSDPAISLADVEQQILWMASATGVPGKLILAGNSLHGVDRPFIHAHMPTLYSNLSHRHLDARTVELLLPDYPWPEAGGHRAPPDVERSIAVLRKGRQLLRDGRRLL